MAWTPLGAAGCWTGPSSLQAPWLRWGHSSWLLYSLNTLVTTLAFSHRCLRPSGATSERLCTPALRSRTESHQISCGLLSPSTCSSPLRRLCWPCAATPVLPFSWSLFPWGRQMARRRTTRPHAHTRTLAPDMDACGICHANIFWWPCAARKTALGMQFFNPEEI